MFAEAAAEADHIVYGWVLVGNFDGGASEVGAVTTDDAFFLVDGASDGVVGYFVEDARALCDDEGGLVGFEFFADEFDVGFEVEGVNGEDTFDSAGFAEVFD